MKAAAPSPSDTTFLWPHSVPAAPSAQCWTRTRYMLLMIQWICLQPSGVYARSKHSDHAKIDYLSLEWSCESWGTGHVQQDYEMPSLWTCETEEDCFVSDKPNTIFYSWKWFMLGISQLKLKTQFWCNMSMWGESLQISLSQSTHRCQIWKQDTDKHNKGGKCC